LAKIKINILNSNQKDSQLKKLSKLCSVEKERKYLFDSMIGLPPKRQPPPQQVSDNRLYAFDPQQDRPPGEESFPLQQEKEFGSYPIVPQQEKPGPEMTTTLQQVLRRGL